MNIPANSVFSHPKMTSGLRKLQSNAAYKLLFVTVSSIALPRIYIDYHRNPYAGEETAFYETYSVATNYALPGALALGTAQALNRINNPLGVNTRGWVIHEYVQHLASIYQAAVFQSSEQSKKPLTLFIENSLKSLQGIDPLSREVTHLQTEDINRLSAQIETLISTRKKPTGKIVKALAREIAEPLGTYDRLKLKLNGKTVTEAGLAVHPEKLVRHLFVLGTEFQKAHGKNVEKNIQKIAHKLSSANRTKAWVSLALVSILGFSAQFINRWITLQRTGNSGFVGYSDFGSKLKQQDPNKQAHSSQQTHQNNSEVYFGGLSPTQFLPNTDQLKYVIYPAGIIGKLLASRSMDELRETAIKAGFAYFNFLMIPDLVENGVAYGMRNPHIFNQELGPLPSAKSNGSLKQLFQNINRARVRSYDDIEIYSKRLGQEMSQLPNYVLESALKGLVRSPVLLIHQMALLPPSEKAVLLTNKIQKELFKIKNLAVVSGILYSCLTLGIGLNLLNIMMTNHRRNKTGKDSSNNDFAFQQPLFSHSA